MDLALLDANHSENTDGNWWNYKRVRSQHLWLKELEMFFTFIIIQNLPDCEEVCFLTLWVWDTPGIEQNKEIVCSCYDPAQAPFALGAHAMRRCTLPQSVQKLNSAFHVLKMGSQNSGSLWPIRKACLFLD